MVVVRRCFIRSTRSMSFAVRALSRCRPSNGEIAESLRLSLAGVKSHVRSLFAN